MDLLIVLLVPSPNQKCEVRAVSVDFPDSDPLVLSLHLLIIFKKI
ncbi:MAG: hypothetical protein ACLQGU_23245 [bacterium]